MKILLGLVAAAALAGLGIQNVPRDRSLGNYATTLEGRTRNQRHNAWLSCQEIHGQVIRPGEEFSFNRCLKGWTVRDGYRKAPVSYNGQLIDSWGGGVCQTASTLYNAALLSGMEIIERNPHRFAPSYVPPGRDAAVAYEDIDLIFRNPHSTPVTIHARAAGNLLKVEIRGTANPKNPISIQTQIDDKQRPNEHRFGTGQDAKTRNSGKFGYEVQTWRVIGERRQRISHDYYPVMDRVIEYR